VVAIGTVDRTENRVQTGGGVEVPLDVGGGNGHTIAGLVACSTGAAVGAKALEERSTEIDGPCRAVGAGSAGRIRELGPVGHEARAPCPRPAATTSRTHNTVWIGLRVLVTRHLRSQHLWALGRAAEGVARLGPHPECPSICLP
jgi:hypothetical protein